MTGRKGNNMYIVDFNTGAGNINNIETLEKAMKIADENTCYTQCNIDIEDSETGRVVATRRWYGVAPSAEDEEYNIIKFGSFGFYDDWTFFNK